MKAKGPDRRFKMTEERVVEMRQRYAAGESQASLVRAFNVSLSTVRNIVTGMSWRDRGAPHVKRDEFFSSIVNMNAERRRQYKEERKIEQKSKNDRDADLSLIPMLGMGFIPEEIEERIRREYPAECAEQGK